VKFSGVKQKILKKLNNIKPILKKVVDFHMFGAMGYNLAPPVNILGKASVPDIRRAELKGIKEAIAAISAIPDDVEVKNSRSAVNLILRVLGEMPEENPFGSFSRERIMNIIRLDTKENARRIDEPPWRVTFIGKEEILIPGKSEYLQDLLNSQKKIYWRTYSFISELKKFLLTGIKPTAEHLYITVEHKMIEENFEISDAEVVPFIISHISAVLKVFYPSLHFEGARIKSSIFPPLMFYVFSSSDAICLFLFIPYGGSEQTVFSLIPISEYARQYFSIHFYLLSRYIDFLQGNFEDEQFSPYTFWVKWEHLQSCIPPNAKIVFRNGDESTLLFSRKTGSFFQIVSEKVPYYRVTIFPREFIQQYLEKKANETV